MNSASHSAAAAPHGTVRTRAPRRILALSGLILAGTMVPGAAHAGFLEQLFGLEPAPRLQQPVAPRLEEMPRPRRAWRAPHKLVEAAAVDSGRQTPTDLMHDKTLRRGDAVMMKDGLHVYAGGGRGAVHTSSEFVALDHAGLPAKGRAVLASIDPTRVDTAARDGGADGVLASGRSAAVGVPVSSGTLITDARGSRLRYVGP